MTQRFVRSCRRLCNIYGAHRSKYLLLISCRVVTKPTVFVCAATPRGHGRLPAAPRGIASGATKLSLTKLKLYVDKVSNRLSPSLVLMTAVYLENACVAEKKNVCSEVYPGGTLHCYESHPSASPNAQQHTHAGHDVIHRSPNRPGRARGQLAERPGLHMRAPRSRARSLRSL